MRQEGAVPRGLDTWRRHFGALLALVTAVLMSVGHLADAAAQEAAPETAIENEAEAPGDPLGRDTPLGSVRGYVMAADQFDWTTAARYLDLRNLPPEARRLEPEELAQQFYFILQRRSVEIDSEQISDRPEGNLLEEQPDYRDELGQVITREGQVSLLLQRVPSREGRFIWKVSNATVGRVPDLYEEFSYPQWVETIRAAFPEDRAFLGIELFKWVIIVGFLLVATPLVMGAAWLLARMISGPSSPIWSEVRRLFLGPVTGLVVIFMLGELVYELGVGVTAYRIMQSHTLATFFVVWFIWAATDIWRARRRSRYEQQGRSDAAVLGRPIANAIKLVTLVVGLIVWLSNAGVDVTALLTGLGIGGIAVALALQKPIEDLFGAISIYSQQPVNTGDLCRYGDSVGRVEEIGLRTTRIRTLSNSLVNVPNAQLSTGIIENLTARTKIVYQPDLPLRYDTTREQLVDVLGAIEQSLVDNPRVEDSTIRVRLREFSPNAIIVRIRAFALTQNFDEYLEIVQEINLEIMRLMDERGVRFSQGAQTLFVKGDGEASRALLGGKSSQASP
jgi:MscS family membrane protein